MADVVEAIHKITYEVDDAALQQVQKIIQLQIQEFNNLNKTLQDIQKQIERTGNNETAKLDELSRKLEGVMGKLNANVGKTKGLMEQLGDGFLKAAGAGDGLEGVVSNFLEPFIAGLPELIEGATTIEALAAEVFSFSNVVTATIAVLGLLMGSMSETKEKTKEYNEEAAKLAERSKKIGEAAGGEIAKLLELKTTIENTTTSHKKRNDAIRDLQQLYPGYFDNLSKEEMMAGKVAGAYNKVLQAILANAKGKVLESELEQALGKLTSLGNQIKTTAVANSLPLKTTRDERTGLDVYGNIVTAEYLGRQNNASDATGHQKLLQPGTTQTLKADSKIVGDLNFSIVLYQQALNTVQSLLDEILENNQKITSLTPPPPRVQSYSTDAQDKPKSKPAKLRVPIPDNPDAETLPEELKPKQDEESPQSIELRRQIEVAKAADKIAEEQKKKELDAQERRKQHFKETVDLYKNLAEEAVKAINSIYEAQIQSLDKEIDARKERVSVAEELAKRGNVEALAQEKERLQKAQDEREKIAKRQLQLNAILQASNQAVALAEAIGAIVKAAAEGDPYTIALRVAAAVAALVAGIASLSNAFKSANSYADGVVDFKGKGGPRDDANWVRISSGESVITAEGTKKNRHLLEAINKGAALQFAQPSLAYTMPAFAPPQLSVQGYASQYDLRAVENKLDNVVNAIEDNRMKQNIYFNEHGVGLMTEKAMRRERTKWK